MVAHIPKETTYTLTSKPNRVIRDVDGVSIFEGADSVDWQHYQTWLAAGNTPNPYVPTPPTRRQETDAYLAGGLTIQFTSSTSMTGTYPVVEPASHNINAIATSLAYDGNAFPMGASWVMITDMAGEGHQFDKNSFKLLMRAIRDFVYQCNLYGDGHADALPPNETSKSADEIQP